MAGSPKPDPKLLALAKGKEAMLVGLLAALSEELAGQLAEALELDRLAGGKGLPFDAIMNGLRPKLRQREPGERKRVMTPQRAFFEVLDGLIINDRGEEKQPGRIARRSLDPLWRWMISTAADKLDAPIAEVRKALLKSDKAEQRAALAHLDTAAGETIRAALKKAEATPKYGKELTAVLGGQRCFDDMKEIGRILNIAAEIRTLKDALPAIVDDDQEDQFGRIKEIYSAVIEKFPAGAPYIVLSLANRVSHPWELFGLSGKLVDADDDQDLKQSDLSMVGEWLVIGLETEASALKNLKVAGFDPLLADDILRRFAVLQAGMTREVGMRKDGVWGKRLLKARGAVSEGLEAVFAEIIRELQAGLPMHRATSGTRSGALVPVFEAPPDAKITERLELVVQFLQTARLFSGQLGYGVAFEKTKTEVSSYLESFGNGVVEMLHAHKKSEQQTTLAWAEACQRVMAQIFTGEAVKIFARRLGTATAEKEARA